MGMKKMIISRKILRHIPRRLYQVFITISQMGKKWLRDEGYPHLFYAVSNLYRNLERYWKQEGEEKGKLSHGREPSWAQNEPRGS
jgi:hypothetical protein